MFLSLKEFKNKENLQPKHIHFVASVSTVSRGNIVLQDENVAFNK